MSFINDRLRDIEYREYLMEKEAGPVSWAISKMPALANWGKKIFSRAPKTISPDVASKRSLAGRLFSADARNADGSLVRDLTRGTAKPMVQAKPSFRGAMKDNWVGAQGTRGDFLWDKGISRNLKSTNEARKAAGKEAFKDADSMLGSMSHAERQGMQAKLQKDIAAKTSLSKMDFLKNHTGEALHWYGQQVGYKGLMYGMPAYDMYDAARDPNRGLADGIGSTIGGTAGFLIPGKARGFKGLAAQVGGSIAGSMAGGKLAKSSTGGGMNHAASGVMNGSYRVPPPQMMPPPQAPYPPMQTGQQPPPPYYG